MATDGLTPLVFLDTETTGLDPARHEVWEIAYAVNDGPIQTGMIHHSIDQADPAALRLNGYWQRLYEETQPLCDIRWEIDLRETLGGATVVGSNPAFDTSMLRARWSDAPWHHRLIDIATYAMPALGLDRPAGLAFIADQLDIQAPDHTAAGDVYTLRECWRALSSHYAQAGQP